jgi:fructosamine-3-kinase
MFDLSTYLIDSVSAKIGSIKSLTPIKGGDIGEAYKLTIGLDRFFLKIYSGKRAESQIKGEIAGYKLIQSSNTILMPSVIASDYLNNEAYLILEYIEQKIPNKTDFERFGYKLRSLHNHTGNQFGSLNDNMIGELHQSNILNNNWSDFFTKERLIPQLRLAIGAGFINTNKFIKENQMKSIMSELLPNDKPSITHGDLWSGNFIIDHRGVPYLIDPSSYYGHGEVDIAMTRLFGGFDNAFYSGYYGDKKIRFKYHDIYQLYYLLVHLNLFGVSYLGAVTSIMNKYFLKNV